MTEKWGIRAYIFQSILDVGLLTRNDANSGKSYFVTFHSPMARVISVRNSSLSLHAQMLSRSASPM